MKIVCGTVRCELVQSYGLFEWILFYTKKNFFFIYNNFSWTNSKGKRLDAANTMAVKIIKQVSFEFYFGHECVIISGCVI